MRVPSSTPWGMLTDSVRSRVTRPEPEQDGQASSIIWPRPWQPGQVRSSVKKPWAWRTRPAPPQVAQVFGLVPALAPVPEQASQVPGHAEQIFEDVRERRSKTGAEAGMAAHAAALLERGVAEAVIGGALL